MEKISTIFLAHFFRAGLCKLHQSGEIAHDAFNRYCEEFPSFFETREAILLAELITSVKNKNFGDWTKAIEKHELCTRLDPWTKVKLFAREHVL